MRWIGVKNSSDSKIWKVCVLLIVGLSSIEMKLIVRPSNVATVEGSGATLECSTNETTLKLRWYKITSTGKKVISTGTKVAVNLYAINNTNSGQFDLIVRYAKLSVGGTYVCEEFGRDLRSSAELIVMESEPACLVSLCETNYVQNSQLLVLHTGFSRTTMELSCSLSYQGSWAPVMEWKLDNVSTPSDVINITSSTNIKYSLILGLVNSSHTKFTCSTKFMDSMQPHSADAANVPSFSRDFSFFLSSEFGKPEEDVDTHEKERMTRFILGGVVLISWAVIVVLVVSIARLRKLNTRSVGQTESTVSPNHVYVTQPPTTEYYLDCQESYYDSIEPTGSEGTPLPQQAIYTVLNH